MTVPIIVSVKEYVGNGTQTQFVVPFRFILDADLIVKTRTNLGDITLKVITTDYTLTGAGLPSGGLVTFGTAPTALETVRIERFTLRSQLADYIENSIFPAEKTELALDLLQMQMQELGDRTGGNALADAQSSTRSLSITGGELVWASAASNEVILQKSALDGRCSLAGWIRPPDATAVTSSVNIFLDTVSGFAPTRTESFIVPAFLDGGGFGHVQMIVSNPVPASKFLQITVLTADAGIGGGTNTGYIPLDSMVWSTV